ncbi:50S ribosomal protein L15 [Candidatus Saccharibacteria bacterium RIFCSPHIGHO2_12_FULL_49_19]|nr:MAG: 50S ribosomal protein L15 [Candidatus Saccharibacteria bacterium RIFCSPHIGHO2_01_FULL_49_21]OGL37783.1 MAG: 50S ribosomal protein L15 [Candidatus Saccharibacteria bacterium RIFCSPHIGHO2_12_FULL_49_19]OGL38574.1 MAG: 50S ribosomal protein L15 [Candidatus Saccharibacteria bacterium RIFCSPLOWO2_01_FULL_49_22]
MKYNELTQFPKRRPSRRVGRGISAGQGKTAGRGTKGQGARKSGGVRSGFEGGQMPLYMRLPKLRGFKSHRSTPETVKIGQLELVKKSVIDNQALYEAAIVSSPYISVKLIAGGELKSKKDVKLQKASVGAISALEKAGGSFTSQSQPLRPQRTSDKIK